MLCVLVEKSFTTPDQYPLTTNALVTGCNQKTSREPVVNYSSGQVDAVMQDLRTAGWARTVRMTGNRTNKHKHVVGEKLPVNDSQLALLAVLGLRGAQSPGELKTRTERYVGFESFDAVVEELVVMASMPKPLVRNVGTQPGQSQDRWIQLLGQSDLSSQPQVGSQPQVDSQPQVGSQPQFGSQPQAGPPSVAPESDHEPSAPDSGHSRSGDMTPAASPSASSTANDRLVLELADAVGRLELRVAELENILRSRGLSAVDSGRSE